MVEITGTATFVGRPPATMLLPEVARIHIRIGTTAALGILVMCFSRRCARPPGSQEANSQLRLDPASVYKVGSRPPQSRPNSTEIHAES
jgi:hypothetical protein